MSNPQKAKGDRWERRIVAALRAFGFHLVERNYGAGRPDDTGDIQVGAIVIEAKDCVKLDLAGWITEAERETAAARATIPVVWHHRRGKADAEDGYVTMTGRAFMLLASSSPFGGRRGTWDGLPAHPALEPLELAQLRAELERPWQQLASPSE